MTANPKNIINVDSMFEPIVVTIDGKEHIIEKITQDQIETLQEMGAEINKADPQVPPQKNLLGKQLSILIGCPEDTFKDADFRKMNHAMRSLMELVTDQVGNDSEKPKAGPSGTGK